MEQLVAAVHLHEADEDSTDQDRDLYEVGEGCLARARSSQRTPDVSPRNLTQNETPTDPVKTEFCRTGKDVSAYDAFVEYDRGPDTSAAGMPAPPPRPAPAAPLQKMLIHAGGGARGRRDAPRQEAPQGDQGQGPPHETEAGPTDGRGPGAGRYSRDDRLAEKPPASRGRRDSPPGKGVRAARARAPAANLNGLIFFSLV